MQRLERVRRMDQVKRLSEGLQTETRGVIPAAVLARNEAWEHTDPAIRRLDAVCVQYVEGTASKEDIAAAVDAWWASWTEYRAIKRQNSERAA